MLGLRSGGILSRLSADAQRSATTPADSAPVAVATPVEPIAPVAEPAVEPVAVTEEPAAAAEVEPAEKTDQQAVLEWYIPTKFKPELGEDPMAAALAAGAYECLLERANAQGAKWDRRKYTEPAPLPSLDHTIAQKRLLTIRSGIEAVLSDPSQLPTVPAIYYRLSRLLEDPKVTANQVAGVVGSDPVCASRLLQLVNSPFYGVRGQVKTISQAVKLLGFDAVKSLVLAVTAQGMFQPKGSPNAQQAEELWYHSIGCGVAARVVARHVNLLDPEQYFVGGLLHDIGKIILFRSAPEDLIVTLQTARDANCYFSEAEDQVCGTNHSLIGQLLGEKWQFPANLTEAVSLHHRPDLAKVQPILTAVVHVANSLARSLDIGSGGDKLVPPITRIASQRLKLEPSQIRSIMADVEKEYPEVQALLTV